MRWVLLRHICNAMPFSVNGMLSELLAWLDTQNQLTVELAVSLVEIDFNECFQIDCYIYLVKIPGIFLVRKNANSKNGQFICEVNVFILNFWCYQQCDAMKNVP